MNYKLKFHYDYKKDPDGKNQEIVFSAIVNAVKQSVSKNNKINILLLKSLIFQTTGKTPRIEQKNKVTIKLTFQTRKTRIIIDSDNETIDIYNRGDEAHYLKKLHKNPDPMTQAKKLYQDFNRYPPEKLVKMKLPINRDSVFVRLGNVDNLEYLSDKKIYESDKKTRKRKIRTYIHNFSEHGKTPLLLTNEAGNILVIYDPNHEIEVKSEGII